VKTFIPFHTEVMAPGAEPTRWMLVLHGILGTGINFRGFARRLAAAHPSWGFVLVDLRMHGRSQDAPPPHTLEAAAEDLARLEEAVALPVRGVMGHSFGGKVALLHAQRSAVELDLVWVLDSPLGVRRQPSTAEAVLRMLHGFPRTFASREAFTEHVMAEGHDKGIAEWLAMNVRREGEVFRFGLDLDAIDALMRSYLATDLWPAVESPDSDCAIHAKEIHVAVADRSNAFDAADRARLRVAEASNPHLHAHLVENAGHWVHVDAPDALFAMVSASL
jgi:pimeloyl-ACP methyl ester carboxylesterase